MLLKAKFLAALAALTGLECAAPFMPAATGELGTSRQALTLPQLPPRPTMKPMQVWEPGLGTGLPTSSAQHAHLVLMRDPYSTGRVLAYGFDAAGQTNLFAFNMTLAQVVAFQNQWAIDVDAWRMMGSGSIKTDGSTDGIGGGTPVPAPRPGFMESLAWKHAYYAWQMQTQIDQEAGLY